MVPVEGQENGQGEDEEEEEEEEKVHEEEQPESAPVIAVETVVLPPPVEHEVKKGTDGGPAKERGGTIDNLPPHR